MQARDWGYTKKLHKMFSSISRSQGKNIVSATSEIIEIHVVENAIRIIPREQFKKLQQSPLHNRNNVKIYVTSMNCQNSGLSNKHKIPFYLMV